MNIESSGLSTRCGDLDAHEVEFVEQPGDGERDGGGGKAAPSRLRGEPVGQLATSMLQREMVEHELTSEGVIAGIGDREFQTASLR